MDETSLTLIPVAQLVPNAGRKKVTEGRERRAVGGRGIFTSDSNHFFKVLCAQGSVTKVTMYSMGVSHTKGIQRRLDNICLTTTGEQLHSNMSNNSRSPKMVH